MVPNRTDIAFVGYAGSEQAAAALNGLNGFRLTPDCAIVVAFANK